MQSPGSSKRVAAVWLGSALMAVPAFLPLAACASGPAGQGTSRTLAVTPAAKSCADLRSTDLVAIGGAGSRVTAAAEARVDGITVCAVEGVLAPSIGFKVHLPVSTWTQRYLQVGCGGLCGSINLRVGAADGCVPLTAGGFVIASTDMGHSGMGGEFGRDPQKRRDFAYRGVHLTAVASKALIKAYYGKSEAYSYFSGCSDGGREALMEAQRFPDDFDGIVAGAPAMNFQVQNSLLHGWQARSNTGTDGSALIVAADLPLLHAAVLKACDEGDGLEDGLISDPRQCRFDPQVLACGPNQSTAFGQCFSPEQIAAVRRFYDGPRDPASGERLTVGGPQPGSELAWAGVFVPMTASQPIFSEKIALDSIRNLIFDPLPPADFPLSDLQFNRTTFDRLRTLHPLYDTTNPDLTPFASSGGKLILWHGWADQHISPTNTIAYHEAVVDHMGLQAAQGFERLYLLPGVYHCSGGEGPGKIDFLTPMMAWVEQGVAPDGVVASQTATSSQGNGFGMPAGAARVGPQAGAPPAGMTGPSRPLPGMSGPPPGMGAPAGVAINRSRPVYPYPMVAAYVGHGDVNDAASYHAVAPSIVLRTSAWAGSDFYKPYAPLQQDGTAGAAASGRPQSD